jgi:hypothetical protein
VGLLLGPVGLWYKGQWAAGFAWLVMAILFGIMSGGCLATKVVNDGFRLYKPWDIERYDIESVVRSLGNLANERQNPLRGAEQIEHRRNAIKVSLGIP